MTLELVDHRAPAAVKHTWTPFASAEGYEHPDWWSDAGGAVGDPWFVQVLERGVEVARVQLDERGGINPSYAVRPSAVYDKLLEIQHIEVALAARARGVGTDVVRAIAERTADRQLMAYSMYTKQADSFWDSLAGWERFDNPDGRSRPLFLQRPR